MSGHLNTAIMFVICDMFSLDFFLQSLQTFASKEVAAYAEAGSIADEVLSAIRIVTAYNGQKKEADR